MERIRQMYRLLQHLGEGDLTTFMFHDAEEFVCKLYHVEKMTKTDDAIVQLFNKCKAIEVVPPTPDALYRHIERAHYQTLICRSIFH